MRPRAATRASGAGRSPGASARGLAASLVLAAVPAAGAEDPARPGAYCPLPEKGEVPRCLDPAQDAYGDFFSALERDAPEGEEAALARVEDAVARGADDAQAYLALSSLSYGYYRLARRAAASEGEDPEIVRRLARWNDLLALAYSRSAEDEAYREAVRQAAQELSQRAPVRLPCRDAEGRETECTSTESVLRGFQAVSEEVGIRGALAHLLRRWFGSGPPDAGSDAE